MPGADSVPCNGRFSLPLSTLPMLCKPGPHRCNPFLSATGPSEPPRRMGQSPLLAFQIYPHDAFMTLAPYSRTSKIVGPARRSYEEVRRWYEDVVQFRRAPRGAVLASEFRPGPALDWVHPSRHSPTCGEIALAVTAFPGRERLRLCARRP